MRQLYNGKCETCNNEMRSSNWVKIIKSKKYVVNFGKITSDEPLS